MFRQVGMVCAGALLLVAAAGCSLNSFLVSVTGAGGKQQVVAGSVDRVSAHLMASLSNAGILVSASRDGQDVRLAGATRAGKKFTLVLRRRQTDGGESTAVTIEWQKDVDEEFWLTVVQVLSALEAQEPAHGAPSVQQNIR